MATATVKDVAKVILQISETPISNLKLQKLLYYVQGWNLGLREKPAFTERTEAWVHGPVVPEMFYAYRHYRWNPIDVPTETVNLPQAEIDHIREVVRVYGKLTAYQLEVLSHEEEPWINARKGYAPSDLCNVEISHWSMQEFFSKLANA